jgi:hypothetical protein
MNGLIRAPGTEYEVKVETPINGVPWLGYVDGWNKKSNYAFDLKTTRDASPASFQRDAWNFGYFTQAAIYAQLTGVERFYIFAVESQPPYNVQCYAILSEELKYSTKIALHNIDLWKKWDGLPKGYDEQVLELKRPAWIK